MIEVKPSIQLILDDARDGHFNMAFDEYLFRKQIQNKGLQAILRFYRFSEPTLTVGYGMWRAAVRTPSSLPSSPRGREEGEGVILIRRLTGGGIVAHTPDDLTYSLITSLELNPQLKKAEHSYCLIHEVLKDSFKSFGLNAELYNYCHSERSEESRDPSPNRPSGTGRLSGRPPLDQPAASPQPRLSSNISLEVGTVPVGQDDNHKKISYCFDAPVLHDVMLKGKKIAGAGQKRSFGYLLHQGSILWKDIIRSRPDFRELDFCQHFSDCLNKALNHG